MAKMWLGTAPAFCDVCGTSIVDIFIDGATRMGPWANMCPSCHQRVGRGIGTGQGQRYERQVGEDGVVTWTKTGG